MRNRRASYALVAILGILAGCGGIPAEAKRIVLADGPIAAPITVTLPEPLTREGEDGYRKVIATPSFLPPIPPFAGRLSQFQPEALLHLLQRYDAISVFSLPGQLGAPIDYFRYVPGSLAGRFQLHGNVETALRLAHREHVSITYSHCYDINPMGMGKTRVCAFTLSYQLASDIPGTRISLAGQARSTVVRDPNTGKWQLDQYAISEPSTGEVLEAIAKVASVVTKERPSRESSLDVSSPDGKWEGTYMCGQGETGLTLTVVANADHTLGGTFRFYPIPANPHIPEGEYEVQGIVTGGDSLSLQGKSWIRRPKDYEMVSVVGTYASGTGSMQGVIPECRGSIVKLRRVAR